ncbi:MAG: hypothetical protein A2283_07240 [Lentisphaerae bacterium RIFOXYA12_FULL_48_11]|nr:MAG: hypothetical protein A2283_07240 [Lentisphaerae bacterium RIFOXYA12_FULL_48_11]
MLEMKYAYIAVLCCLFFTGCSACSVGWLSHPQSGYPVNDNDMYLNAPDRKMQTEQPSSVKTNNTTEITVWIWQKEFWTK